MRGRIYPKTEKSVILMSIRETPVGSGSETPVGSGLRFAMTPWEILTGEEISHLDCRVYGILAACRRGPMVKIGTRLIARYVHTSQRRVVESIRRLCRASHLVAVPVAKGRRAEYMLTSEKFSNRRANAIEKLADAIPTPQRRVELVPCAQCRKLCRPSKTGWCRSCVAACATEKIARRVSREEIVRAKMA